MELSNLLFRVLPDFVDFLAKNELNLVWCEGASHRGARQGSLLKLVDTLQRLLQRRLNVSVGPFARLAFLGARAVGIHGLTVLLLL